MVGLNPIFAGGYLPRYNYDTSYLSYVNYSYFNNLSMPSLLFNYSNSSQFVYDQYAAPDYSFMGLSLPAIEVPPLNLSLHDKNEKSGFSTTYLSDNTQSDFGKRMASSAKKYLGCCEANGTHMRFITSGNEREAWCADFVSYIARECGIKGFNYPGVKQIHDWGNRHNKLTKTPKIGDVVIFQKWDAKNKRYYFCHTGIVTDVKNGRVYTIEGNASDAVRERNYALGDNYIKEYVRLA